jgi:iron complex transport system permease protein
VVARVVLSPQEVPLGIITALLGAPFFLWVLRRSRQQNLW